MTKGYRELVEEAEEVVETLTVEQALALHGRADVAFVDVRDPRERDREGAIPGARLCPRGMLEFWIDPDSPYHLPLFSERKQFVFYCSLGWRSALAARTAQEMGLSAVAHIGGGLTAWIAADGPIERRD